MPDPHVLYAVTTVVVLGLIAWVIFVLLRAPVSEPTASGSSPSDRGAAAANRSKLPEAPPSSERGNKLDSHSEIRDEPSVEVEEEEEPTGPNILILVNAVGRTDRGRKRKNNEDAY